MNVRRVRAIAAVAMLALLAPLTATTAAAGPADTAVPLQVSDRPLLRLGDRGPAVATWQHQLRIVTGADVAVDGVYDTTTERATANFQRFFGLRVDGIVGEQTRALMRYLLAINHAAYEIAADVDGSGLRIVGYQGLGEYCLEAQDGDYVATQCGEYAAGPLDVQLFDLGPRTVLLGTAGPGVAGVEVQTDDGARTQAALVSPPRFSRSVWASSVPPSDVALVRALAGDGSEIRRIAVGDERGYLVLERGNRGPRVQQWQRQLNAITNAGVATDGIFGMSTVTATQNFQRFFGLRASGVVGPDTRELMEYLLAVSGAPPEDDDPEGALGEPTTGESASADFPRPGTASFLTDVRVGEHQGFDRVVLQFDGEVPSWHIEPVQAPIREQPSGRVLSLAGDSYLRVTTAPASGVDLRGEEPREIYTGPERITVEGSEVVELVRTSDFENHLSWTIGLRGDVEYGVAELTDPSRLVIDIR